MPRAVDLVPQGFKADYDPTNQLAQDPASVLGKNVKDVGKAIAQLNEKVQAELKRLIDTLLGIAANPIPEIVDWLEDFQNSLSNVLSWIKPGLLPLIPLSQIGEWFPNLILNGGFDDAKTLQDNPDWSWDGTVGRSGPLGSVKTVVSGVMKILHSNDIPVVAGQKMTLESWAQWSSFSAPAGTNPIRLIASHYLNGAPVMSGGQPVRTVIASFQPPTADSTTWEHLTGSFPVPAGVDAIRVSLQVTADATAGLVWFDDANAIKVGKLPLDYVQDLVGQLQQFTDDIGEAFNQLAEKVGLDRFKEFFDTVGGKINAEISDITGRLQAIGADGKIDAAEVLGLLGLGNIPLLPQNKVTDLPDLNAQLNQIRDIFAGLVVTPINSTIQSVKDWFTGNNNKTQGLNSSGQLAGSAITGLISEAATGIGSLKDGIVNAATGQNGSGFDLVAVMNSLIGVKQIADQAGAAAAAANAQLAKSQGQQNAAGGGLNYTTVFGGADGAALPAVFTGSDLKVRGNNGYAGIAASKPDGTYVVTCNKQYSTDDQSLAVVLGDQGGSLNAPEYHLFHSDSGYTAGACLKIDNGSATIGSYTRSGASITFTAFSGGTWSGALGQGSLVEVHNVGTTWTLAVNGNTVLSVTSSAVTFGASTRYGGGFVMQRATVSNGWFQGTTTYDSFRVAAITLSDYVDPVYLGSGATMARTSATNVTIATGTTVLPNSFYSVVQSATPDIACNLTNGTMTVSLSGWYLAKLSTKSNIFTNSTNSSGQANPAIFVNSTTTPSKLGLPQQYSRSNSSDGSVDLTIPVLSLSDSFVIYLNAGDVVRGGQVLGSNASTRQVTGDSAGTATYLSLALLNRSQI
ncbi:bacteriophage membrane protein [Mycobacteroides abscessus subsp. massiliense]|nr:bacteriophage membrane protein [Mycobacteroides abscessus subsp. massiliense]